MFDPVDPKQSFPALERAILRYWKEEDTFKRSIAKRRGVSEKAGKRKKKERNDFSFYDGPPFATGLPHYGHLLAGTIKDVIPRYQTMRGKTVQRRFGWDCHGLPVEYEIEKEHGIQTKKQIEEMGVKAFNDLCREAVQRYAKEWRTAVERMGRWVDMDWDYRTMDPDYMESIWWVFKSLHDKGLLYEGAKPMHVCPRCETPLSNFEVTQGYKEVTDISVTAMFELTEKPGTYVLAWTTTPWTLPGNLLLAVNPAIRYVSFPRGNATFIASEQFAQSLGLAPSADTPSEATPGAPPLKTIPVEWLLGQKYKPLFPYFAAAYAEKGFRIVEGSFVTTEEGTGVVHIAPGFGEDDYNVGKREGLPLLQHVTLSGRFTPEVKDFKGADVKPADDPAKTDRKVAEWLKGKGLLFGEPQPYRHSYPHCWRCDSPLLNYATSSWFVSVEKIKEQMLQVNKETEWVPGHIRDGRFGKWLEGARDWAVSRNRYWGTPLPIWRNEESGEIEVLGSRDDLMRKVTDRFTKVTALRHGESEGNIAPVYQGEVPGTDLTAAGKKQAKEAGLFLKEQDVAVIYCSPLARTRQTAKIIAKATGAPIVVDERLKEVCFGEYEGKHIDFSDLAFVKARRAHRMQTNQVESIYHFPGMETWKQVHERLQGFLNDTLPKHRGKHVVVVTHADLMLNMKHFFTQEDPAKLTHQPYPEYADTEQFFWDHRTGTQLDLHKETIDPITWPASGDGKGAPLFRRIPDVLDCWFESGAMPYAQSHFPFDKEHITKKGTAEFPPGFPADFIAEGIDQTRGWFYTLTVLSAALFNRPAFFHCIVNGTVLAEDGKKMSKRLKNYPEPLEVVEKYGADAIRLMLMGSPAVRGEDMRFSEKGVEEVLRSVLLPLWNAYVFLVTYANAAGWEPKETRTTSGHPLDTWIRAEVQDLANRMTAQLEKYDLSATCGELSASIDALTNWYVRLSRRRFAGKGSMHEREEMGAGQEEDRAAACATLYDVLLTISQLLAPFAPFIAESMYLNLVGEEHGSVHLTDWPAERELTEEEQALLKKTRLLRTIVSLGLKLRAEAKVKLRQPLAKATIAIPASLRKDPLTDEELRLLQEELNVKEVALIDDPGALGTPVAQVDARKVGPRLGARVQELIQAGKRGEFTQGKDGSVVIGEERLAPDEVTVVYVGKEGQNVAGDRGVVVGLDTAISDQLVLEGCGRDLIRAVQRERKEAGLNLHDRIKLQVEGADDVLKECGKMIEEETNATLTHVKGDDHETEMSGKKVVFRFEKL
ncbi:MAG: class I tRNA ligase family protein [Candidatus Peribacteraceae bacterium]|jgi:isoleucyl-tRNA synthetase